MLHVTLFYSQTIHSLNFLDPACLPNAFSAETSTGESVFAQLLTGGIPKFALVVLAVTIASFAPAIVRQVHVVILTVPSPSTNKCQMHKIALESIRFEENICISTPASNCVVRGL